MAIFERVYPTTYSSYHKDVIKACNCVNTNRCSILGAEVERVKSLMSKLGIDDIWKDSAKDDFQNGLTSCIGILDNVTNSINSLFTRSEEVYTNLLDQLNQLQNLDGKYELLKNDVPKRNNYENETQYNNACKEYNDKKLAMETNYMNMVDQIESYKEILVSINNCLLDANGNISSTSGVTDIAIPSVVINQFLSPLEMCLNLDYFELYTDENGEKWYVIKTGESIQDILYKFGRQTDDACHDWSVQKYGKYLLESTGQTWDEDKIYPYCSEDINEICKIAFDQLCQEKPKPTTVRVNGLSSWENNDIKDPNYKGKNLDLSGYCKLGYDENGNPKFSRHFVAINGINANADPNDLKSSDFRILDPALPISTAIDKTETWIGNNGVKKAATRSFLQTKYDFNAGSDKPEYYIEVYNDGQYLGDGQYLSENVKTGNGVFYVKKEKNNK